MIENILESIKKPLGISSDYDVFDEEVMMHINSVFSTLYSIGASPPDPFFLATGDENWSDFLLDVKQAAMVKSYMYIKIRLIFDPPATSFALEAMKNQATEWEWRLGIMEFVFNPNSRPIDDGINNAVLADLVNKVEEIEEQVEDIDDEVDSVPDLTQIFRTNLDD